MVVKYLALLLSLSLTACYLTPVNEVEPTRPSVVLPSQTPAPLVPDATSSLTLPTGVYDALPVMQGICFESAWDAAGQLFIVRNAEEHIRFYELVDNARLCRQPVQRLPFDFSTGDVLAGLWTRGAGCTASYSIPNYARDDTAKTIRLQVIFSTEGSCPYELVRGLWLGFVNARDYQISIEVIQ
jgi:hypothetical protein